MSNPYEFINIIITPPSHPPHYRIFLRQLEVHFLQKPATIQYVNKLSINREIVKWLRPGHLRQFSFIEKNANITEKFYTT